jgi:hypothetical protein
MLLLRVVKGASLDNLWVFEQGVVMTVINHGDHLLELLIAAACIDRGLLPQVSRGQFSVRDRVEQLTVATALGTLIDHFVNLLHADEASYILVVEVFISGFVAVAIMHGPQEAHSLSGLFVFTHL